MSLYIPPVSPGFSRSGSGLFIPQSATKIVFAPEALHRDLSSSTVNSWLNTVSGNLGSPASDALLGASRTLVDSIAAQERHDRAIALFNMRKQLGK